MNVRAALSALVLLGSLVALQAQEPAELPSFEVASVRMAADNAARSTSRFRPGRYIASNITLRELIWIAYDLALSAQVRGGPAWIDSARFDVQATASDSTPEQMRGMLQQLLAERFMLKVRLATEEWPAFALTIKRADQVPNGLRAGGCQDLPAARQGLCGGMVMGGDDLEAHEVSMPVFAEMLSRSPFLTGAERIVIDETGLPGAYSFELRFARQQQPGLRIPERPDLPGFTTALQEQLGLALTPTQAPTTVVIVESADRPAAN